MASSLCYVGHGIPSAFRDRLTIFFCRIVVATEIYGYHYCGKWLVWATLGLWGINCFLAIVLSVYLPVVHFLDHPHGHKEMPPSFMLLPTIVIYTATVAYGMIDQLPVYVELT